MIAKTVNEFFFVILEDNFNKNGSYKCASFKKCLDLGLVNFLSESSFVKVPTWCNFWGVAKTIDYLFVFSNLVSTVVVYSIANIEDYFNTDYSAVYVSVGLGGLLDVQLNSLSGAGLDCICFALCDAKKSYHVFKLTELLWTKKSDIRSAVEKRMKSFAVNKSHTICSALEHFFCKVVLNHLVSDGNLILDPVDVKEKIDKIIKDWTRKKVILRNVLELWQHQYLLLNYLDNSAFSEVINAINYDELLCVVKNLLDNKAAGLFGIPNKLWKHCNSSVFGLLLILLNLCLVHESISHPWKEAWVSMICKPYK
ncbi:hypothetical protein G9A89_014449 [Geosiphon pyriformis]|nr:hypothetical protein G9A89_014449 [Geosiphon pyriformis]